MHPWCLFVLLMVIADERTTAQVIVPVAMYRRPRDADRSVIHYSSQPQYDAKYISRIPIQSLEEDGGTSSPVLYTLDEYSILPRDNSFLVRTSPAGLHLNDRMVDRLVPVTVSARQEPYYYYKTYQNNLVPSTNVPAPYPYRDVSSLTSGDLRSGNGNLRSYEVAEPPVVFLSDHKKQLDSLPEVFAVSEISQVPRGISSKTGVPVTVASEWPLHQDYESSEAVMTVQKTDSHPYSQIDESGLGETFVESPYPKDLKEKLESLDFLSLPRKLQEDIKLIDDFVRNVAY